MGLQLSKIQSLCLLRLSAIGDVCHAVAMVQAIQNRHPQLEITWIIGKVEYQLVRHLPGVRFVIFDKSKGWRSYRELKQNLAGKRFDVLLHMQVALRATLASLMISAKTRIGFDWERAKEGQFLVTNHRIKAQKEPHVLDGFMAFAQCLGVTETTPKWNIPIPAEDLQFAQQQIPNGTKALIISPAASKPERNWLPERYAAVADHAAQHGMKIYLCGGPSELEQNLAENIIRHCQSPIINLVGKTSLLQMLALLKQASLVIAPDTGPAHMAVTQGTPVIGLYAHSNPKRTGPYLSLDNVVSVYDDVIREQRTTGEIAWGTRAKGSNLMQKISEGNVINKIDYFLKD